MLTLTVQLFSYDRPPCEIVPLVEPARALHRASGNTSNVSYITGTKFYSTLSFQSLPRQKGRTDGRTLSVSAMHMPSELKVMLVGSGAQQEAEPGLETQVAY